MNNNTSLNGGRRALLFFASIAIIALVMGAASFAKHHYTTDLFDAKTGYRLTAHRTAVPAQIEGGKVIGLDALEALIEKDKPLLIDVMSVERGWLNKISLGQFGKSQERLNIPGSIWLPKLGLGQLADSETNTMKTALETLSAGQMDKPVVFYCLADCWVSWNAARRAIAFGYSQVYWFREGTDVWNDAGLTLAPAVLYDDRYAAVAQKK